MDMKTLHADSIRKSFDRKKILSDIFLTCQKGEIKGLIGKNGSGKSTLLKIIFGTEKADTKFVRVGDQIIRSVTDGRHLINYLPQDNFLPYGVSVKTIVKLFLEKDCRKIILENEHVKPILHKKNEHLSGGEKRIIEILLIVHSKADFILLDEPFNGVSPIMRDYIIKYIKTMKSKKGFIITDHDYENVIGLADKIVFLQNGFLRPIDEVSDLVELGYMTTGSLKNLEKK
jgi:ABC-type multidrug transport system ATPase subunit